MPPPRDIYGRRPVSRSRGKTDERIMALQHDPATLPGADEDLADAPEGSIAAAVRAFHQDWVAGQPVTTRRTYERALVLLVKDLAERGPAPGLPLETLSGERLVEHLDWRVARGLTSPPELLRTSVHLARWAEWCDEGRSGRFGAVREPLRAAAEAAVKGHGTPWTGGFSEDDEEPRGEA